MSLDFKRASDLFLGSEDELALALGVSVADLREHRQKPERAPDRLLAQLGRVLVQRGKGMKRVGELLLEDNEP
jgi:hypothetical protein